MAKHKTSDLLKEMAGHLKTLSDLFYDYEKHNREIKFLGEGLSGWERNVQAGGAELVGNMAMADRKFDNKTLNWVANRTDVTEDEIRALDEQRTEFNARIKALNSKLSTLESKIKDTTDEMCKTYNKLLAQFDLLKGKIIKGPKVEKKLQDIYDALVSTYNTLDKVRGRIQIVDWRGKDPSGLKPKTMMS